MLNDPLTTILLALLACALLVAAVSDLRSRKIGNGLNAGIALLAPLFWWASGLDLWPGVALQLAVALATFAVCAGLFAMRAMGGGDVKLLTALALWITPWAFLQLVILMALLGGVLTILFSAWHIMRRRKDRLAIPYGVAISGAGLWIIGTNYMAAAPALAAG